MYRCSGHSATIRGVDWSTDSSILMSNSNDSELLFWNSRTGKQVWGSVCGGVNSHHVHTIRKRNSWQGSGPTPDTLS